jgi:hypothetical protein
MNNVRTATSKVRVRFMMILPGKLWCLGMGVGSEPHPSKNRRREWWRERAHFGVVGMTTVLSCWTLAPAGYA